MVWKKHRYDEIQGTYVFDGRVSHGAYALNKLLFSFNHEENRQAFDAQPEAYARSYGLSDEQRKALLEGDFLSLIRLGANIYFLSKLVIPRGVSVQDVGAQFQSISTEEFRENLARMGEGLEEKLKKAGGYWRG